MIIDTISTDHFRAYQGLIPEKKHLICKKYTILTVKFAIFSQDFEEKPIVTANP